MTRINVVPVSNLPDKFLMAEYREITRVYRLVWKQQLSNKTPKIPDSYRLGTGHVTFFYDKLLFINKRYLELTKELYERNFNISPIGIDILILGLDSNWFNDYTPTTEAIAINQERLDIRSVEIFLRNKSKSEL